MTEKPRRRWSDGRFRWERSEHEEDKGALLCLHAWTDNWRIRVQANNFKAEHFTVRLSTLRRTTPDKIRKAVEHLVEVLDSEEWPTPELTESRPGHEEE